MLCKLCNIYKLYNIENVLKINVIKNLLKSIILDITKIKNESKFLRLSSLINNSSDDIRYSIIQKEYQLKNNLKIIQNQKNNKFLNNLYLKTYAFDYYFKEKINFSSPLYLRILQNINNQSRYIFILDPFNQLPIGIRLNIEDETTLYQFNYFAKKLEKCINNKLEIMLQEHEITALFFNTSFYTFPTVYLVYEARNYILSKNNKLKQEDYIKEMIKYVNKKGFVVNIYRQNNQYVMGLVH